MSALAPWLALQKRAPLLLTGAGGDDVEAVGRAAVRRRAAARVEALILVADLPGDPDASSGPTRSPPTRTTLIEMEPLTPDRAASRSPSPSAGSSTTTAPWCRCCWPGSGCWPRRTGRAARWSPATPAAGCRCWRRSRATPPASSATPATTTTACSASDVSSDDLPPQLLPEHDIFLWEGHHSTLIREFGMPELGRAAAAVVRLPAELPGPDRGEGPAAAQPRRRRRGRLARRAPTRPPAAPVRWPSSTPCSTTASRSAARCGRPRISSSPTRC